MAKAKKLPSGSWRCQVYDYTDTTGKRHYKSFTADTRKGAEYQAAEYALNKKDKPKLPEYSLKTAIENYSSLKSNVLSPATIREYRRMKDNYFDELADVQIKDICSENVQMWVNSFAANHSPKTVKNAYGLISAVLDAFAPDIRLRVTLPQKIQPDLYVPSDSDIKAILGYFSENDKDMEIAVYLAAFGTLRRSEVCALTADDVKGNVISINKAMVDKGNSEWVVKTTKTISSTRTIEMPEFVVRKFPRSGQIVDLNPDQVTRRFERAFKKLRISPFRFHDLRHYAASIMHAIGVPDQYIMQRGGWGSDRTLKAIYRGTIKDYEEKFTNMTLSHFDNIQHEISHKKEKP